MPQLPGRAKANWFVPSASPRDRYIADEIDRIFTQKEVELARARMPTEAKLYTGLFKWKDIKRWHTTWHVWLCKCNYP